jgi:hypothetical protein
MLRNGFDSRYPLSRKALHKTRISAGDASDGHRKEHRLIRTSTLLFGLILAFALYSSEAPAAPQRGTTAYRAWAIKRVWPSRYESQAVRVARCESGIRPWARNGQYRGAFQMGSAERERWGHGPSIWAQARAALRYFNNSGKDWSPWQCRP